MQVPPLWREVLPPTEGDSSSFCPLWASWRPALQKLLIALPVHPAPGLGSVTIHGPGLGGERGVTKAGDRLPRRSEIQSSCALFQGP